MMQTLAGLMIGWGLLAAGASPVHEEAPAFTLRDTYGQPVSIKGYRGSVVWLTFGATW